MKELKKHLTWYRLRDPARPDNVYGDGIRRAAAFQRAAKLAGFYQQPIEAAGWSAETRQPVGTRSNPGRPHEPDKTATIGSKPEATRRPRARGVDECVCFVP